MMKVWTSEYADQQFSAFIRARDPFCFFRCGRRSTDCSHYWKRGDSGTRYDPMNCDGACRYCHDTYGELKKEGGIYEALKIKQLGRAAFDAMARRAHGVMKREAAVLACMALLGRNPQA